jgi:hypothetical protein
VASQVMSHMTHTYLHLPIAPQGTTYTSSPVQSSDVYTFQTFNPKGNQQIGENSKNKNKKGEMGIAWIITMLVWEKRKEEGQVSLQDL